MTGTKTITIAAAAAALLLLVAALLWLAPSADGPAGAADTRTAGQGETSPPPADQEKSGSAETPSEEEGDTREESTLQEWTSPRPAAADERVREREEMVRRQIAEPRDVRESVADEAVLRAMRTAPRHVFVPEDLRNRAYGDTPLPIGHGQTISQPYIVAFMTEKLQLEPGDRVLEIGTGSGYQAAVLGQLTPEVFTIEIIEPLAERAGRVLKEQGYTQLQWKDGDGYYGWKEHAPFDAIIVTAAAGHVPPPLWEQLAPGGRMVIPIGGRYEVQRLILMEKTEDGGRRSRSLMPVSFVPLTGDHGAAR